MLRELATPLRATDAMTPTAPTMIRTKELRIDYGDVTAVRDLTLEIAAGEVYGLIGPNGAGKTSTIRTLATLQEPTYGEVEVAGFDVFTRADDARRVLGYMPDLPPVYDELYVWEFLDVFAGAYGIAPERRRARVDECILAVSLQEKRKSLAGSLSRGMKQRLVLAKTLLHEPKVLLLDEPASGLDPLARIELREVLKRLGKEGKTVLVSSHILTELNDFCTSIGIMQKGRLVVHGTLDEIAQRLSPHKVYAVRMRSSVDAARAVIKNERFIDDVREEPGVLLVRFTGDGDAAADLLANLVRAGVRVESFYEQRLDVEDIFLQVGATEAS